VCANYALPNVASVILTPWPGYGRAAKARTLLKMRNRLKSLKMFIFRAIVFRAVWYQECLSISRSKFRGNMNFKARISKKGDLTYVPQNVQCHDLPDAVGGDLLCP
jgi:hypothetical protein